MSHTPGPWLRDGWNVATESARDARDGRELPYFNICKCNVVSGCLYKSYIDDDEVYANANLIAAAPDLLSQLELAFELLTTHPAAKTPEWMEILSGMVKTIKSAKGLT
jgi:hypothetical protein